MAEVGPEGIHMQQQQLTTNTNGNGTHRTTTASTAADHARDRKDLLKKRGSKSRLSKQDEIEEPDADDGGGHDTSPGSEAGSEATVVARQAYEDDLQFSDAYEQPTPYGTPDPSLIAPETVITEHHNGQAEYGGQLESQHSVDSTKDSPTQNKSKLVRCHALCEDASPPPDSEHTPSDTALPQHNYTNCNTLQVSPTPQHRKLALGKLSKDSSIGSENGSASGLSRDSSFETANYTDSTGIDLEHFIEKTLNKNTKDRMMLLKLEQDMINFIKDEKHQFLKFPSMSSYHRMLVHRIAAFFGLDHNVDQSGKSVVVNRTPSTRIPDFRFREHIQDTLEEGDQPKKILKKDREYSSLDEQGHGKFGDSRKSKSFEERKEVYEEARKRIFDGQSGEMQPELLMESPLKHKGGGKWGQQETRLWSSQDSAYSSGYSTEGGGGKGGSFTKASSFGGVSLLSRGNSSSSTLSSGSKMSKTDSQSSGFSGRPPTIPSSPPEEISETESNVSSPQADCGGFQPFYNDQGQPSAVWVCTQLDTIPPGSVLINPNTGQPFTNQDGSLFRWQPQKSSAQQPAQVAVGHQQHHHHPLPPNSLQVPSQQNTHVHTEQKYQDSSVEAQQQISQLTLTSPQPPPVDNISSEAPPPSQQGSLPPTGGPGGGAYHINSPQMAGAAVAQQTYPQGQVQYFAPNQATSGQPVRYIYSMPYGGQPSSQPQDMQQNIQTQVAQTGGQVPQQQQQPVAPPPPQEGSTPNTPQQQYVYSYPAAGFHQMTVQSVDYGQQQSAANNNSGNSQQPPPQQQQYQGYGTTEVVGNVSGTTNQGYSSHPHQQVQPQQGGMAAPPLTPQGSSYSGIPVHYYSSPPISNSSNSGGAANTPHILSYQQQSTVSTSAIQGPTPNNNNSSNISQHHTGVAATQQLPGALRGGANKTPPTAASHQVIIGGQSSSYPPQPPPQPAAVISIGYPPPAVNSVVAVSAPQSQYHVSYATYPQQIPAAPQPQTLPQQRVAMATASIPGIAANHHHHHPQMIFTSVPAGPQGFTMVRGPPVATATMRNTPPPQQPPTQTAQLPPGYPPPYHQTPIKIINMAPQSQMGKEQMEAAAAGGMIVNEKGEPGGNHYIASHIQGVVGQPLLSNGLRVAGVPQIRPQNPAAFRTASPIIQHVPGEVRLVGHQYVRPLQPLYSNTRPRIPTPTGQHGNHRQNRSRKLWMKSSQDSMDSNPSSSMDSPDQTPQIASPLSTALLEVSGLPPTLKCGELSSFLCDLTEGGATVYVHSDDPAKHQTTDKHEMAATQFTVLVSFPSDSEAARALSEPRKSSNYVIMSVSRIYEPRSLCMI